MLVLVPCICKSVEALMVGAVSVPVKVGVLLGAEIVSIFTPATCSAIVALKVGALTVPSTSNLVVGLWVPMPTSPSAVILSRSSTVLLPEPVGAVQRSRSEL